MGGKIKIDELQIEHGQRCPKCDTGMMLAGWRTVVCINCGYRVDDDITQTDMLHDVILWWCIRNRPNEVYPLDIAKNFGIK